MHVLSRSCMASTLCSIVTIYVSSCFQIRLDPWGVKSLRRPHILFVLFLHLVWLTVGVCVCVAYCQYTIKCRITTLNKTYLCTMPISVYNLLVWANTQSSGAGRLACSVCEVTTGGYLFCFICLFITAIFFPNKDFLVTKTSYIAADIYRILSRALKKNFL